MSKDIADIVAGWDYDSNEVRARWIQASDGSRKIQLRLDLGVFQMEPTGRPDGARPRGFESLREFYLNEETYAPGNTLPYGLDANACAELQQEVTQYYYRLMAYHALGDWAGMAADSDHNLDLVDFVAEYAEDDEIAWQFSQLYPYMRMMNARARAEISMAENQFDEAEQIVREALIDVENFYFENFEPLNEDGSPTATPAEVESLRELLGQVNQRRPRTQADTLRAELARAVELENYEKAAFLRDQLKLLQGFGMRSSGSKMRVRSEGRGNAN